MEYLRMSVSPADRTTAVRLSEFEESVHSYHLTEHAIRDDHFSCGLEEAGPILTVASAGQTVLVAYEHGATAPDYFLCFRFAEKDDEHSARLEAVKGNFPNGTDLSKITLETVWFQLGVVRGRLDDCASAYRRFMLNDMSQNAASRKPYIFYNTWNFQERNKWWNGKPYLESMRQDRILREIEVAARMGIEVFVLDTGWYARTGEWAVNTERFDNSLAAVRKLLKERGMKLGLWFSPAQSAVSARISLDHLDCRCQTHDQPWNPGPVWETEDSHYMCLVSRWWESFAGELIRLHREVGVEYFKWDAISQYGCDAPNHCHGDASNSFAERRDIAAFEQVRYMAKIVNKVCEACPGAIVDFDVTEPGRTVGLAFLSAGKYFLINNGPYYKNLDDPESTPGRDKRSNVFVFPGPARPRNFRATLDYDKWIPSTLFLAHYLPDDPAVSQETNIASLILGHNGIWGDLPEISEEGIGLFGKWLSLYKQVRDDITAADPLVTGVIGGTPEVHEKINPANGRGAVSLFAPRAGTYTYVTARAAIEPYAAMDGVKVERLPSGRAKITTVLKEAGGKAAFFGAR